MIPVFEKSGRRRGIERRQYYLTIHFPDRRKGGSRRIGIDRRISAPAGKRMGKERRWS